jgi:hypothetical protein
VVDPFTGQSQISPLVMAMLNQSGQGKADAMSGLSQLLQAYMMQRGQTVNTGQPGGTMGTQSLPDSSWQPSGAMWGG